MRGQLIAFAIAWMVLAAPARADERDAAEERATAERYFRAGEMAYQNQSFGAAAENFEEAYRRFALPEIAFSAAQAYRRQYYIDRKPEHVQRAVDLYRVYLAKITSGGRVADAADGLAEMQAELDKLLKSGVEVSASLAKQYTRVLVNPRLGGAPAQASGRMREIDDRGRDTLPPIEARIDGSVVEPFAPINVAPGVHAIRVTAAGYFPVDRTSNVPQGTTTIVDVELEPMPARVSVETEPGARIAIDGRPVGTVPLGALELPAGRHVLTISRRGRHPVARELVVARGQQVTLSEPLQPTTRRQLVPWFAGAAGIGAIAATGAAVVAFRNDRRARSILRDDIRTTGDADLRTLEDYRTAVRWRDRGAMMLWVGGAATVGLTGVAALLFYADNPSPDRVRVEPVVTAGGAGAAIAGRF
jgi:hypothetical protein